jgi:putative transposase
LSLRRQGELLGLPRAGLYYRAAEETAENLRMMRFIDEQYTRAPFYGSRRMTAWLCRVGYPVNRQRVQRLMHTMGLEAIYPRPRLSQGGADHRVYPDRLRGVVRHQPNQVWSADITYVPMRQGFMYLVAILDWYSRYVVAWHLSTTMAVALGLTALQEALTHGRPEIFNTEQGAQFTSLAFTTRLEIAQVAISMDGRGRVFDNIFVERLWRTVKYEDIYLKDYQTVPALEGGLGQYFGFYNHQRLHEALAYHTPAEIHFRAG